MTKIKTFCFIAIMIIALSSCTRINPGYAGFKISYSGNYRGSDSLPLETGWVWYMPGFSTVIEFPTSMQHVVWTKSAGEGQKGNNEISIGTKGGAGFLIDLGLNYAVDAQKAAHLYFKYKTNNLETFSNGYLKNTTRKVLNDLAGTITMDSLLNGRPAFERAAEKKLQDILGKDGIEISQLSIITTPRPIDPQIAVSINAKIKAKQDAETSQQQLQQSIAEANKVIAKSRGDSASKVIEALGQAIANQKLQQALTPMLIQKMWIETWDGHLPTYMTGSGTSMLMQMPNK